MIADKPKETQQMSEFGRTLYSLMLTRGLERKQDLVRLLNEGGYKISQSRLSYYFNGERTVDPLFLACVTELLGLIKEERRRLAWTFAYGQLKASEENEELVARFKDIRAGASA